MSNLRTAPKLHWWQRKGNIIAFAITTLVLIAALVFAAHIYQWDLTTTTTTEVTQSPSKKVTTSETGKTLWDDWLQLLGIIAIPLVIGVGTLFFTRQQAKTSEANAENQRQEDLLRAYFDKITELLRESKLSTDLTLHSVIRARTLAVLSILTTERRAIVIRFLHDAQMLPYVRDSLSLFDFHNADLHGIDLSGAHLKEVNLSGAHLNGANLTGAYLGEADLTGAYLIGASLTGADLGGANLSSAHLNEADLSGVNLSIARLPDHLTRGYLYVRLYLNFPRANLSGANLSRANLTRANLTRADLSGANLSTANLRSADLSRTNLTRARLLLPLRRRDVADLSRGELSEGDLSSANLRKSRLRLPLTPWGVVFSGSEADLSGANLTGADLSGANLSGVDLTGTRLSRVCLHNAKLYRTRVTPEQLKETKNITRKQLAQIKIPEPSASQEATTVQPSSTPALSEIKPKQTSQEEAEQKEHEQSKQNTDVAH
jgi:uncharacterized protein YjbI with pentapeptide repeats